MQKSVTEIFIVQTSVSALSALKAEFVNPFLGAGMEVMAQVLGEIKRGNPYLVRGSVKLKDFTVEFKVDGYIQGMFAYTMTREIALKIASGMIGMPVKEMDDLARSALSELGNWVSGRAVSQFESPVNLSIPRILEGEVAVTSPQNMLLEVPVVSQYGNIDMYLWLQENNRD